MSIYEVNESANSVISKTEGGRKYLIRLIGEGTSVNGNTYTKDVLENALHLFSKGTKMFLDHNPVPTIEKLAGVLNEDAYYKDDGIYAVCKVSENTENKIKDFIDTIGVSIKARARIVNGIVEEIDKVHSIDFVTDPSAKGKIINVVENIKEREKVSVEETLKDITSKLVGMNSNLVSIQEQVNKIEESVFKEDEVKDESNPSLDLKESIDKLNKANFSEEETNLVLEEVSGGADLDKAISMVAKLKELVTESVIKSGDHDKEPVEEDIKLDMSAFDIEESK